MNLQELQTVLNDFPEAVFLIDPLSLQIRYANEIAQSALGYRDVPLNDVKLSDISVSYSEDVFSSVFSRLLSNTDEHAILPVQLKHKHEGSSNMQMYLKAIANDPEDLIIATAGDVSLLDKASDELRYQLSLLSHISDAIISIDIQFNILSWNKHAEEVFGWREEEVINKYYRDVMKPEYINEERDDVRNILLADGSWKGEVKFKHKAGTKVPCMVSYGLIKNYDGTPTGVVAVVRDISKEKEKEQQVGQLANLIDKVEDAILSIDDHLTITNCNSGATKLFNMGDCHVGRNLLDALQHVQGVEQMVKSFKKQHYWSGELAYTFHDEVIFVLVSASSVINEEGEASGHVLIGKNITVHKQLEKELQLINNSLHRQVEEKTRQVNEVFERIDEMVVAVDNDMRYKYVNNKAEELLGLKAKDIVGKNMWDLFPKSKSTAFFKCIQNALATQQFQVSVGYDPTLQRWIENHIYPSSSGLSIYGRDVTERMAVEKALRQSEQLYRTIVETAQEGIWQVDENLVTTFINPYMASLLGLQPADVIGKSGLGFINEHHYEQVKQSVELLRSGHTTKNELFFYNKNKEQVYVLVQTTPLFREEQFKGFIAMILNITEAKKIEETLRKSEARYRLMFENNPLPMFIFSYPTRRFVDVNEAMVNKFGYSKEELLQMATKDLRRPHELHLSDEIATKLETETRIYQQVFLRTKDGADLLFEVLIMQIQLEGRTLFLTSMHDITERDRTEQELVEKNEQLRLLASHLQDVREEERRSIAREIHDELGQQLTVLKMDLSWLKKRVDQADDHLLQKLTESIELANTTIQTVRKISSQLRPTLLDDLGLAEAIRWQCDDMMRRTGIHVSLETNVEEQKFLPDVSIALFRIHQEALTNVMRHADATAVECILLKEKDQLILTISDNGKGFEKDQTAKTKSFGLVGIKERVEMLKGKCHITSEPGVGTTLTVIIPLHT